MKINLEVVQNGKQCQELLNYYIVLNWKIRNGLGLLDITELQLVNLKSHILHT